VYDKLVVKRRSWRIACEQLPQAEQPSERLDSFLVWRAWAQRKHLPRYVFVKSPAEPKPIFVDFENPFSLEMLRTIAKDGVLLQVSEMKPAPDELWLEDERGRYCCEFRTSFVADAENGYRQPVGERMASAV